MREVEMTGRIRLVRFEAEHEHIVSQSPLPARELQHFKNVTGSVMQDALNVWAELWGELQGSVTCGVMVLPEAENGFKPSCGWPEFLEKMWLLKHYLDFTKKFSEQDT
ncbi:MAG: hypothetical protein IIB56_10905 [Planctomycetes bacterium]|nr:hypothetical protein [Planctomycetota bacterium]